MLLGPLKALCGRVDREAASPEMGKGSLFIPRVAYYPHDPSLSSPRENTLSLSAEVFHVSPKCSIWSQPLNVRHLHWAPKVQYEFVLKPLKYNWQMTENVGLQL